MSTELRGLFYVWHLREDENQWITKETQKIIWKNQERAQL